MTTSSESIVAKKRPKTIPMTLLNPNALVHSNKAPSKKEIMIVIG